MLWRVGRSAFGDSSIALARITLVAGGLDVTDVVSSSAIKWYYVVPSPDVTITPVGTGRNIAPESVANWTTVEHCELCKPLGFSMPFAAGHLPSRIRRRSQTAACTAVTINSARSGSPEAEVVRPTHWLLSGNKANDDERGELVTTRSLSFSLWLSLSKYLT